MRVQPIDVRATSASGAASYTALFGLQILLVEDEAVVAATLEDMLAEFGCTLAGAAATLTEALTAIHAAFDIDAAILDVNLGGEKVFPVADILVGRNIPIVFSTGFGPADLTQRYPESRLLEKPYQPEALADLLVELACRPLH
ncbi:response regulator [Phenylobacterium sp. LjRoot225]|uniref:response regulator n=1 Tax=Phenylobacterium sp. LjRoot225 TaxID=3342285 RepID=UPI003ED1477C